MVNTKDPRWIAMRTIRLGKRWQEGRTECAYCKSQMWFTDHESIPEFRERSGIPREAGHPKGYAATLDHVIPLSKGGPHHHANLTVMCLSCNSDKAARDPIEWIRERRSALLIERRTLKRFEKRVRRVRRMMANWTKPSQERGDQYG